MFGNVDRVHGHFLQYAIALVVVGRVHIYKGKYVKNK